MIDIGGVCGIWMVFNKAVMDKARWSVMRMFWGRLRKINLTRLELERVDERLVIELFGDYFFRD